MEILTIYIYIIHHIYICIDFGISNILNTRVCVHLSNHNNNQFIRVLHNQKAESRKQKAGIASDKARD